jgi:hypothetical protein
MDEKCGCCHRELEPGSWAQLLFDGTWLCEKCMGARPVPSIYPGADPDNKSAA